MPACGTSRLLSYRLGGLPQSYIYTTVLDSYKKHRDWSFPRPVSAGILFESSTLLESVYCCTCAVHFARNAVGKCSNRNQRAEEFVFILTKDRGTHRRGSEATKSATSRRMATEQVFDPFWGKTNPQQCAKSAWDITKINQIHQSRRSHHPTNPSHSHKHPNTTHSPKPSKPLSAFHL